MSNQVLADEIDPTLPVKSKTISLEDITMKFAILKEAASRLRNMPESAYIST